MEPSDQNRTHYEGMYGMPISTKKRRYNPNGTYSERLLPPDGGGGMGWGILPNVGPIGYDFKRGSRVIRHT